MLEEIFPNIAARPRGGYKRGAFPGLPKVPGLFTQRERDVKTDSQLPTLCSPVSPSPLQERCGACGGSCYGRGFLKLMETAVVAVWRL